VAVFQHEATDFVHHGDTAASFVTRAEFNDGAIRIDDFVTLDAQSHPTRPVSVAAFRAARLGACGAMPAAIDIIQQVHRERAVTRTHQRFGAARRRTLMQWLATLSVFLVAATWTAGGRVRVGCIRLRHFVRSIHGTGSPVRID